MGRGPQKQKGWPTGFFKTEQGFEVIRKDCASFGAALHPRVNSYTSWRALNPTTTTKVPVVCQTCGEVVEIFINNVHKNKRMRCGCSSKALWSRPEGYDNFLEVLGKSQFEAVSGTLTKEWWIENNVKTTTRLPIRCPVCNSRPDVDLHTFVKTKGRAGCWCNGHGKYSTEEGRQRFLLLLQSSRFVPTDWMLDENAWKSRNVSSLTRIPIQCSACNVIAKRCTVNHFVQNHSADCACMWKTEALVFRYCVKEFGTENVHRQFVFAGLRSFNARHLPMPFDIHVTVNGTGFIVEVDGPHHFDRKSTIQNDLQKEMHAVEQAVPVLRLFQNSVWHNRFDWKGAIQTFVQNPQPRVERVPLKKYKNSRYEDVRVGTRVAI